MIETVEQLNEYLMNCDSSIRVKHENWSTLTPTEPGWYFLRYKGYKSRVKRVQCVELAIVPSGCMLPKGTLAYKEWHSGWHYKEIRFHADCGVVEWAGPFHPPAEPAGKRLRRVKPAVPLTSFASVEDNPHNQGTLTTPTHAKQRRKA